MYVPVRVMDPLSNTYLAMSYTPTDILIVSTYRPDDLSLIWSHVLGCACAILITTAWQRCPLDRAALLGDRLPIGT